MLQLNSNNRVVYIAGPISGRINNNEGAFRDAAKMILEKGFIPVVPHDLFMHCDCSNFEWVDYLRVCIAKICLHCDVLVTLPDWELSEGAKLEVDLWRKLGKEPVMLGVFLNTNYEMKAASCELQAAG
jgi:hypothetical protein